MKILHITPYYAPAWIYGGPIVSVHGLCQSLVAKGHTVHVYTTNANGSNELSVELNTPVNLDGVIVHYFSLSFPSKIFYSTKMLKALSNTIQNYDFIHLHGCYHWPMYYAARLANKYSIPYAVTPRGTLVENLISKKNKLVKRVWINLIERETIRNAKFIHLTSDYELIEFDKMDLEHKKAVVIPNGINVLSKQSYANKNIGTPNLYRLLFLGRISWEKGLDRLIKSLEFMPNVHLIIAGSDYNNYKQKLSNMAREINVESRICFVGHVKDEAKEDLFVNSDLMILPSYSENFGNVVLEAWIRGLPVAMTNEVALARVGEENGCSKTISGAPKQMAADIISILKDHDSLNKMKKLGYEFAKMNYSWDSISKQLLNEYMF